MSNIEDGGTAFPVIHEQYDFAYEEKIPKQVAPGMTLRDYFAAKAMQGDIASMQADEDPASAANHIAARAYAVADAMLKARKEGGAS